MPRTGDTYALPSGTAAASGEVIQSAKWNSVTADLAAEQNLVRPESAGGTGVDNLPDLLLALGALAQSELVGAIVQFGGDTAPTGWLECDGSAVSRTTYADLFAAIGTHWGSGDGSTTFNLPDYRGEFPRGWDNGRGVDAGRAIGSAQAAAFAEHLHSANPENQRFFTSNDSHNHGGTSNAGNDFSFVLKRTQDGSHIVSENSGISTSTDGTSEARLQETGSGSGTRLSYDATHDHSIPTDTHNHYVDVNLPSFDTGSTGGAETRPRNVAAMYIIRH